MEENKEVKKPKIYEVAEKEQDYKPKKKKEVGKNK